MKLTKRIASFLLALTMIFTCIPASAATLDYNNENFGDFYIGDTLTVIATDGVFMHSTPAASSYNRITCLGYGNHVYVTDIIKSGSYIGWMKVTCGGNVGWVFGSSGWFTDHAVAPTEYSYGSNYQATVNATAGLLVHKTPTRLSSNVIDTLSYGKVVDATAYTTTGFTKVSYYRGSTKYTGYVSSAWITVSKKYATTPSKKETFKKIYGYQAKVQSDIEPPALNVHVSASVNADTFTTLTPGQVVTIVSQSKSWFKVKVKVNGSTKTGYIYRAYTNKIDALKKNVKLSATKKTLAIKKKYTIKVTGTTGMSKKVTWKTSNKKVATVSKSGVVTAKKAGKAVITCTVKVGSRTRKLTCKITVPKKTS